MFAKYLNSTYWRDIYYQASGNSIAQLIGIIGIPILARLYSPESFAIQSVFLQALMLVTGFVTWRYEYFFQLVKSDQEASLLMRWVFKLGLSMTIVITALIGIIDYFEFNVGLKNEWLDYLYYVPMSAFLVSLSLSVQHNVQRLGDFNSSGQSEIVGKLFYVVTGIVLSSFSTVIGLILTTCFSAIGKGISLRSYVFSLFKYKYSNEKIKHPKFTFSSRANALVCSNILVSISTALPVFFIGSQFGENTLGQYALVMSTLFLPSSLLGAAIGNVFYQRAALQWKERDIKSLIELWKETLIKLAILGIPVYSVFYLVSGFFYPLIFGAQWGLAGTFGELLALYAFFSFLAAPVDRISLILNISSYLPIMHSTRLLLILVLILVSRYFEISPNNFILLLSSLMSFIYLSDIFFGFYFLKNKK